MAVLLVDPRLSGTAARERWERRYAARAYSSDPQERTKVVRRLVIAEYEALARILPPGCSLACGEMAGVIYGPEGTQLVTRQNRDYVAALLASAGSLVLAWLPAHEAAVLEGLLEEERPSRITVPASTPIAALPEVAELLGISKRAAESAVRRFGVRGGYPIADVQEIACHRMGVPLPDARYVARVEVRNEGEFGWLWQPVDTFTFEQTDPIGAAGAAMQWTTAERGERIRVLVFDEDVDEEGRLPDRALVVYYPGGREG